MGCPISKNYLAKKSILFATRELEPTTDGRKDIKKPCVLDHQSNNISDKKVTELYNVKRLIGQGTFSDVYRVENICNKLPFAIKAMQLRSLRGHELFENECSVLRQLNSDRHENIIKFIDIIHSKHCGYIVMELATGGDLLERIQERGYLDELETKRITQMLLSALLYLHNKGITHRDLKPDNVLFYSPGENSRIVLTDFGFAISTDLPYDTYCGTLQYLSPEVIKEKPYNNKVDLWSLGVMVYVMLCGHLPFTSENIILLHEKITTITHSYKREVWKSVTLDARNFIDNALEKDPNVRFCSASASKHVWVNKTSKSQRPSSKNCHSDKLSTNSKRTCNSNYSKSKHSTNFNDISNKDSYGIKRETIISSCVEIPKTKVINYGLSCSDGIINNHTAITSNSATKRAQSLERCFRKPRQLVIPESQRRVLLDELFDASTSISTEAVSNLDMDEVDVNNQNKKNLFLASNIVQNRAPLPPISSDPHEYRDTNVSSKKLPPISGEQRIYQNTNISRKQTVEMSRNLDKLFSVKKSFAINEATSLSVRTSLPSIVGKSGRKVDHWLHTQYKEHVSLSYIK